MFFNLIVTVTFFFIVRFMHSSYIPDKVDLGIYFGDKWGVISLDEKRKQRLRDGILVSIALGGLFSFAFNLYVFTMAKRWSTMQSLLPPIKSPYGSPETSSAYLR